MTEVPENKVDTETIQTILYRHAVYSYTESLAKYTSWSYAKKQQLLNLGR